MRPQAAEVPLLREKIALARRKTAPRDSVLSAIGLRFVLIHAGSFVMGDEKGGAAERPAHPVTLTRDYYMAATPVTAGQFQRYLIDTGAPAPAGLAQTGAWKDGRLIPEFANHPVTGVSFRDAQAFCAWLSKKEGRAFRLPTEAEWEYACRAGAKTRFPWGDEPNPSLANVRQSGRGATTPVASFPPNAWGLYDMIGNACQWCQDVFGPYTDGPRIDPVGSSLGGFTGPERRVVRGGWRGTSADDATCAARFGELTTEGYPWTGFRLAMDADAQK
ncbi:MAG TPA: formylglycine-generating enzyme family protein [Candidatus Brocadiia bacterium]|nr:formylglycine-generating enzyme family protein [Candidatus Brocadiia bacterium]